MKFVYDFGEAPELGKELLGGKGSGLAEMTRIGLPVPPGFTITTEACKLYYQGNGMPDGLEEEIRTAMTRLEARLGKRFGDSENPLLVSVRSGSPISMPGMMDTILNLGLIGPTAEGLARATGDRRFALDCHRRFIQMYAKVVLGVDEHLFEEVLEEEKGRRGVKFDSDLDPEALAVVVSRYREIVTRGSSEPFSDDPWSHLTGAVRAVFTSWSNPRAVYYRNMNRIPDDLFTAVNVQAMVFGNSGPNSGTGVAFTRNPATGVREVYGEFLLNAQGEDVVAGIRTPQPLTLLREEAPQVFREFIRVSQLLEKHYRDVQDIEFTFEDGKLYLLQTRTGKRTAQAAVKIAVDLVGEGIISPEEAVLRVDPDHVEQLLHRRIDPSAKLDPIASGLPASPGAASGFVSFDADEAERRASEGEKVILVRPETTPEDIHGIHAAQGVLTSRGGMTSHAAVVARGMGKACVCGCEGLYIDGAARILRVAEHELTDRDVISIDGAAGKVYLGEVPMIDPEIGAQFEQLLAWADQFRRLGVKANADNPPDAARAREFGATGIGLCRTEHMFMEQDRLPIVQEMIMAEDEEQRRSALDRLLPIQQGDFEGILEAMEGYPVIIRLLDPPLHEFLPNAETLALEIQKLRADGGISGEIAERERILRRVRALSELNPMLGLRGCRLGLVYPEIYEMQARAIFRAAAALKARGVDAQAQVMIPLVGHTTELELMRALVIRVAEETMTESGTQFLYKVGTMIEIPRACLVADAIAAHADFFSFGTNDLTQTILGYSRDDAEGKFLHHYLQAKIIPENPFVSIDVEGVGQLVGRAVQLGRGAKPELEVGICGEHGGESRSVHFFHQVGLDYVSCSPYRVPIARLAAAHAALAERKAAAGAAAPAGES